MSHGIQFQCDSIAMESNHNGIIERHNRLRSFGTNEIVFIRMEGVVRLGEIPK